MSANQEAFRVAPKWLVGGLELLANETAYRQRIVEEARRWVRTPYFPRQAKRGTGCDCGSLIAGVYRDAGIFSEFEFSDYNWMAAWAKCGGDDMYLGSIFAYAKEIASPKPADMVMYRIGRGWSHCGIVIRWPGEVIQAMRTLGVVSCPGATGRLANHAMRFFTIF